MKVECIEESPSRRRLDVEVPADSIAEAFEEKAERFGRTLKLPGFRKGKIPKDLVRNRFRSEILDQVVQDIIPKVLAQALKDRQLTPIDDPRIQELDARLGEPLRFKAAFEVMPEIDVKKYKGFKVTEHQPQVGKEEIDQRLEALRQRAARFDPVEARGAKDGDYVQGTLRERVTQGNGPERKQEGIAIELGTDSYHAKLHESLQGARPGDTVSFNADFPEDHPDRWRAGREVSVQFELMEIKEKVLPEIDDDFAKDLGEFQSLDELKVQLLEQAEEEAKRRADQDLRNQLLEKLLEANPIDPPQALIEHELDQRIEEMARGLIERGIDPSKANVDWRALREGQRESATRSVGATILLDRLVEQEDLKESEEAVNREIEKVAASLERSPEAVRAQMMKEGSLDRLRTRLKRELAVDLVRQSARIQGG